MPLSTPTQGNRPGRKPRKGIEEFRSNKLHPVQVEYSKPIGTRIDMDRELPFDLEEEDPEEVLELLSGPPEYEDRISPVTCMFNDEELTAINPPELEVKLIRRLTANLTRVAAGIDLASKTFLGEKGAVSFLGLVLDPVTISRVIEADYDTADNVYSRLMDLVQRGMITPIATTPFHTLLPTYRHDFEIRLLIRMGLEFYWPMLRRYNRAAARIHGERYFMVPFCFPEGAFSNKVLQILHQEMIRRCEAEKITPCHLVIILEALQSREREQDALMKRWNTLRPSPTTRDIVSVIFTERTFSDWVIHGHPSTKKQLDRTIAKVDAVLRDKGVDHLWSHFEPLRTLLSTFKTCRNFEQKLLKLTELKYQVCSPEVFVRRKLLKVYGNGTGEPRRTTLLDNTCWAGWLDNPASMERYLGYTETGGLAPRKFLGAERPYTQILPGGAHKKHPGNPCWKPALMAALQRVYRAITGEPKTFMGGMLGLIREIVPIRRVPVAMRNIEDFLVVMSRVAWKEHFIHHGISEADIQLRELCITQLLKDAPPEEDNELDLTDDECAIAGIAAHAIQHAYMGLNATAFAPENIDTRATYENVTMMTLAVAHAITAWRWRGEEEKARELFDVFREELLGFEDAFERHDIGKTFGVDKKTWKRTIASEVPQESPLNVVERAARRTGGRHLRPMGFRKEFSRKDENISTATGHLWTEEIGLLNMKWENEVYCGLREE